MSDQTVIPRMHVAGGKPHRIGGLVWEQSLAEASDLIPWSPRTRGGGGQPGESFRVAEQSSGPAGRA